MSRKLRKFLLFPGRVEIVQEDGKLIAFYSLVEQRVSRKLRKFLLFPGRVESVQEAEKVPSIPW